jgi:hypothetical protein
MSNAVSRAGSFATAICFNADSQSDQGSALVSLRKRHKRHLLCRRHFLVSLKQKHFRFRVAQLIEVQSRAVAHQLKEGCEAEVRLVDERAERRLLATTLAIARLAFVLSELVVLDVE